MDLSDIFNDPRARAKKAEALHILRAGTTPAERQFNSMKRELGRDVAVDLGRYLITEQAQSDFKAARISATRTLIYGYAELTFRRFLTAGDFIGSLDEIKARVQDDLVVSDAFRGMDPDEANLCILELQRQAWDRETPTTWRHRIWLWLRGLFEVNAPADQAEGAGGSASDLPPTLTPPDPVSVSADVGQPDLSTIAEQTAVVDRPEVPLSREAALARIDRIRTDSGKTKNELSEAVGLAARRDKSAVLRVLNGETRNPGAAIQNALFDTLHVNIEDERSLRSALGWTQRN